MDMETLQAISDMIDKKLDEKLEPIKADISVVKSDLSGVKSDLSGVKSDLSEVKQRVLKVEVTQENDIAHQINLLAEGHSGIVEKLKGLDTLREKVEDIQNTVDILKHIVVKK